MKIFRCDTSPYQSLDFSMREQKELETLGLTYLNTHQDASILITNTLTDIKKLDTLGVELMIHPNSGYDNYPLSFVQKAKFPIIIGSEIRAAAVTEYILYCLLERFSKVPCQKTWDRSWPGRTRLKDQRVLILGLGYIGKKVRASLTPLVDKLWAIDPFVKIDNSPLKNPTVVILCMGLNETSKHFIDTNFLNSLPGNVTIINAARGKLIKQDDLLTFLKINPNSFAYLDVFEQEPASLENLNLANLALTSHIAGVFKGLDDTIINFEKKVITDFRDDRANFEKKYYHSILKNRIHDNILI